MFLDLQVRNLTEPLTGRRWDRQTILRQFHRRIAYYQSQGMTYADRTFVRCGKNLEFFIDLPAIWSFGGCAIPIDSRLTGFQVETLATAAPRFSLWNDTVDKTISFRPGTCCVRRAGIISF